MSDFASLVAKLNEISANEDTLTESEVSGVNLYQPVETIKGTKSTANILRKFSEIQDEIIAEERQMEEDVVSDIRTRYSDFMKSETAQGNDLNTINVAVKEATSSAMAIDDSFNKMFNMMDRLLKVTGEDAVLSRMVEREGGDPSWIADAHQKLVEAMEALEEAHMYAVRELEK